MLISYLAWPNLFSNFIHNSFIMNDTGNINPSNLSLIKDVCSSITRGTGILIPNWVPLLLFIVVAVVVIIASTRAFKKLLKSDDSNVQLIIIFFTCLVYALISPRFKDYSYILLIVPSYYIISRIAQIKTFPILFVILILSGSRFTPLPGINFIFKAFWAYYPLILTYFIWSLYIHSINKQNILELNI